jgi:hypothetical protein
MTTEQKINTSEETGPTYQKNINLTDEDEEKDTFNYNKYLEALDEYYKKKNDYEGENSDYYKKKIKLKKNKDLTRVEKYKEMQRIKANRKCVNCGNPGGTLFDIRYANDGTKEYIAMCMAHKADGGEQCDFQIHLKKGKVKYINNIDKEIIHNIKKTKQKIISSKLSLLFDLQPEDVVLKEFDDLKDDLEKYNNQLKIVEQKLGDNNSIKVLGLKDGDPSIITKKEYLKIKYRKLNDAIYEFKNRLLKIDDDDKNTIRNAFDTYIDISNTQGEIRDIIYDEHFVDYDAEAKPPPGTSDNPYYIIKKENSIQKLEIFAESYQAITNEK